MLSEFCSLGGGERCEVFFPLFSPKNIHRPYVLFVNSPCGAVEGEGIMYIRKIARGRRGFKSLPPAPLSSAALNKSKPRELFQILLVDPLHQHVWTGGEGEGGGNEDQSNHFVSVTFILQS